MVKLRLTRMGSKKKPFYRIVASNSVSPRDGRFIEVIGTYNPSCSTSYRFNQRRISNEMVT